MHLARSSLIQNTGLSPRILRRKVASAAAEENDLEQAIEEAIQRSRLVFLGGKEREPDTVRNICLQLKRLPPYQVKEVLEIMEDKCRYLAQHGAEAQRKTWGWIVGAVRGEVNKRVGELPDLAEQVKSAAAGKGFSKAHRAGGR